MVRLWIIMVGMFLTNQGVLGQERQSIIHYESSLKVRNISDEVEFFEDPGQQLTIQDILHDSIQSKFFTSEKEYTNFGVTNSAIWCRITIVNDTEDELILRIKRYLIYHIEIYTPKGQNQYNREIYGALYPYFESKLPNNYFTYPWPRNTDKQQTTIYLRIISPQSIGIELPIQVGSSLSYVMDNRIENGKFGFIYGILISIMIYHLFIYFILKETQYLYFVFHQIGVILMTDLSYTGILYFLVWPETPEVNLLHNTFLALSMMVTALFSTHFLNSKKTAPKMHYGFYVLYAFSAIVILVNLSGQYFIANHLSQIMTITYGIFFIGLGTRLLLKKHKLARFYLIGILAFMGSIIIYVIYLNKWLPEGWFTSNAPLLGSITEAILFSFALADRFNIIREKNRKLEHEKFHQVEKHNELLERKVGDRTLQIATQNQEILAQNEELSSQQDIISQQNQYLSKKNKELQTAHQTIKDQHNQLQLHMDTLEGEVNKRTEQLKQTNQQLLAQYRQAEQFAFMTAHNLRSPIARILGLANILQHDEVGVGESEYVLHKIVTNTKELDDIIHDMSEILNFKKGISEGLKYIELEELLYRIERQLENEIKEQGATIITDFFQINTIYSFPQYLESIMFNLLSNALKYKCPDRDLEINVFSQRDHDMFNICFKDNGIGMDLEKIRNKLYSPYQRFNTHTEGRGLGLHFVKLQVEALKGQIEVESEPDVGTTFKVRLPITYPADDV